MTNVEDTLTTAIQRKPVKKGITLENRDNGGENEMADKACFSYGDFPPPLELRDWDVFLDIV